MDYKYVSEKSELLEMCSVLEKKKEIAVDLECENQLHYYGSYIALIQISTKDCNWIVDVLELKEITSLLKIFENPKIIKIFHDVSFDLRILNHQFQSLPKNIFDTQLAAFFLGIESVGLGALLEKYFEFKKEKKFQMADWTRRPISSAMLDYAMSDTKYLIKLKEILFDELRQLGRDGWFCEEMKCLEGQSFEYREGGFLDVTCAKHLEEGQLALFKRLFELRDKLAKEVNRPVHFVIRSPMLIDLAREPPKSIKGWLELRSVHPIVKRNSQLFYDAVLKSKDEKVSVPKTERKKLTEKQKVVLGDINTLRDKVSEKLKINKSYILSKDQMLNLVTSGSTSSLKKWQKELLGEKINKILAKSEKNNLSFSK